MEITRAMQPFDTHGIKKTQAEEGAHRVQPINSVFSTGIVQTTPGKMVAVMENNTAQSSLDQQASIEGAIESQFRIAAMRHYLNSTGKPHNPNN